MKLVALISLFVLTSCSSVTSKYNGVKILASSDGKNTRPEWTLDSGFDVEDFREKMGDDAKNPKNAYFTSQAAVSKESLIPNCYSMARTRAASEVSANISETLQQASTMTMSADSTEFDSMIESGSKNMIVGAKIVDKAWIKIETEEDDKYRCFIALSVPRKNIEKLQEMYLKELEKKLMLDSEQKQKVQDSIEEKMKEKF